MERIVQAARNCFGLRRVHRLVTDSLCTLFASPLRAVPVSGFLRGRDVLTSSMGSADDYARSDTCHKIGTFVSHSWSCDAGLKHQALLYAFYWPFVWAAAVLLFVLCMTITLYFDLTAVAVGGAWYQINADNEVVHVGTFSPFVWVCPPLVFGFFWLMPYVVPSWLVRRIPQMNCFLDKCCISQTEPALKKAEIERLGAYILRSDRFLLVLDSTYVERLWTMYELATFAKVHGHKFDKLQIVSVDAVDHALTLFKVEAIKLFVGVTTLCTTLGAPWANALLATHVPSPLARSALLTVLYAASLVVIYYVFFVPLLYRDAEQLETERRKLEVQLETFSVKKLRCSVEADRVEVENSIVSFFGSFDEFENLVKEVLKEHLMPHYEPDAISRGLICLGIVLPELLVWGDFALVSWLSPSGGTEYSFNAFMMAFGFTFVWCKLKLHLGCFIFKRARESKIADSKKRPVAIALATVALALGCSLNLVFTAPVIPQEIYCLVLVVACAALWTLV